MKYGRMTMPDSTSRLVGMCLEQLKLGPCISDDETIAFPLRYEDGSLVTVVIMAVAKKGLFSRKPAVAIIAVSMSGEASQRKAYLETVMPAPKHPDDILFTALLAMHIKTTAWAIAGTEDMGECVHFPKRPNT